MTESSHGNSLKARIFLSLAMLVAVGCGGDKGPAGPARASASGKVTFDGKPVVAGSVSFIHKESGNPGMCVIVNGEYKDEEGNGPVIGDNTLSITGLEMIDGKSLWGGVYSKEVTVTKEGFKEDFAITAAEVKPADPNYVNPDDEMNE